MCIEENETKPEKWTRLNISIVIGFVILMAIVIIGALSFEGLI